MAQLPLMHKSDRLEEFPLQGKNEHRFQRRLMCVKVETECH